MRAAIIITTINPAEIKTPVVFMPFMLYHLMLEGTSLIFRGIGADLPE
jgi:hypothetical protein